MSPQNRGHSRGCSSCNGPTRAPQPKRRAAPAPRRRQRPSPRAGSRPSRLRPRLMPVPAAPTRGRGLPGTLYRGRLPLLHLGALGPELCTRSPDRVHGVALCSGTPALAHCLAQAHSDPMCCASSYTVRWSAALHPLAPLFPCHPAMPPRLLVSLQTCSPSLPRATAPLELPFAACLDPPSPPRPPSPCQRGRWRVREVATKEGRKWQRMRHRAQERTFPRLGKASFDLGGLLPSALPSLLGQAPSRCSARKPPALAGLVP